MSGPDFHIPGEPRVILARSQRLRRTGERLEATGEALKRITAEGWQGLAADDFRAAFDSEPKRWLQAGEGFTRAAWALENHARALEIAQGSAETAQRRWARGNAITEQAQHEYAAAFVRANELDQQETFTTGKLVGRHKDALGMFEDPGEPVREQARGDLTRARNLAGDSAAKAARIVRESCAHAPAKQNWLQKSGSAYLSLVEGAVEAMVELNQMLAPLMVGTPDFFYFWGKEALEGVLDPEEKAAENELRREAVAQGASGLATAAREDPVGLAKQVGYAAADIDTWKDDPARAVGHLVPDAVASVASGGTATAATRGLHVARALGDTARATRGLVRGDHLAMVEGLAGHADEASDVAVAAGRHTDDLTAPDAPNFSQAPREHLFRPDPAPNQAFLDPHDQPTPGTATTTASPDTPHAAGQGHSSPGAADDVAAHGDTPVHAQAPHHDTPTASPHEAPRVEELVSAGVGARHAEDAAGSAGHAGRFADDAAGSAGTAGRYADNATDSAGHAGRFPDEAAGSAGHAGRFPDDAAGSAGHAGRYADDAANSADVAAGAAAHAGRFADDAADSAAHAGRFADDADAESVPASPEERAQAAYERFADALDPTSNTPRVDDVPVSPHVDAAEAADRSEAGGISGERFLTAARGEDVSISPETAKTAAIAGGGLAAAGAAGLGIRAATRAGRHVDDVAYTATGAARAADRADSGAGGRLPDTSVSHGAGPHGAGRQGAPGPAVEADFPPGYDLHDPTTWGQRFDGGSWRERMWGGDLPTSKRDLAFELGARYDALTAEWATPEDLDRYHDALARVPRPSGNFTASAGAAGRMGPEAVEVTLPNGKKAWLENLHFGGGERWLTEPPSAGHEVMTPAALKHWAYSRPLFEQGWLREGDFADYHPPLEGRDLHSWFSGPRSSHAAGVTTAWQRPEEIPDALLPDPDLPIAEVDRILEHGDVPRGRAYAPDADMLRVMSRETDNIDADMSKIDLGKTGDPDKPTMFRRTFEPLYRHAGTDPGEVARHGFVPRKHEGSLNAYVGTGSHGPFTSTSKSLDIVDQHGGPTKGKDWLYVIDAPGGVDVNASLDQWPQGVVDDLPGERLHAEHEVAFFGLRPERIQGVYRIEWSADGTSWRPTQFYHFPGYKPSLDEPPDLPFKDVPEEMWTDER